MTSEPPPGPASPQGSAQGSAGVPGGGRHRAAEQAGRTGPPVRSDPAPPTGDLPVVRIPDAPIPLSPPLIVRRLVFTAVLVVVAASVLVTVLAGFRAGGTVLAGALLLAAVARAVLPAEYCLGLLVRSRQVDAAMSLVLAVAVAVCAWIVPGR